MKAINQIINSSEYKYHTFTAALKEFACDSGASLYFDSFSNKAIIYHLKDSRNFNMFTNELSITRIPTILKDIETQISKQTYDNLQKIYDEFMKLAIKYEYADDVKLNILSAYELTDYKEMWENEEFSKTFRKDVMTIAKQLQPIQDLVMSL